MSDRFSKAAFARENLLLETILERLSRAVGLMTLFWLVNWVAAGSSLGAPFATTQAPGPLAETSATLNGMGTPNGVSSTAWFEWGTTTAYGQITGPVSAGNGSGVIKISAALTGLVRGQ